MRRTIKRLSPKSIKSRQYSPHLALKLVENEIFNEKNGDRPVVDNAILFITDTKTETDQVEFLLAADSLKDAGVKILTIGVGDAATSELEKVASPGYTVKVTDYKDFSLIGIVDIVVANFPALQGISIYQDSILAEIPGPGKKTEVGVVPETLHTGTDLIDVAVIFQISQRIKTKAFNKYLMHFLKQLFQGADVDSGNVRVSLMNYGRDARVLFDFNAHQNITSFRQALSNLNPRKFRNNKANPSRALQLLRTEVFTPAAGDRAEVANVILLITDTMTTTDHYIFLKDSEELKASGVKIFTIGTGSADETELRTASTGGMAVMVDDYEEFSSPALTRMVRGAISASLEKPSNDAPFPTTYDTHLEPADEPLFPDKGSLDFIIVFHLSPKIKNKDVRRTFLPFLYKLLDNAEIDSGKVRVSLLTFDVKPTVRFYMNRYKNKKHIQKAIKLLSPKTLKSGMSRADLALNAVRDDVMLVSRGDRSDVQNTILFITDTPVRDEQQALLKTVDFLKRSGVRLFAMGIGAAEEAVMERIASEPGMSRSIKQYKDLEKQDIVDGIVSKIPLLRSNGEQQSAGQEKPSQSPGNTAETPPNTDSATIPSDSKLDLTVFLRFSKDLKTDEVQNYILPFLTKLVEDTDLEKTKLALVVCRGGAKVIFALDTKVTKTKLLSTITRMIPKLIAAKKCNSKKAIGVLTKKVFTSTGGDRPDARNAVLFLTNTKTTKQQKTFLKLASKLKEKGTRIFAIGMDGADIKELQSLATPGHVYTSNNYDELRSTDLTEAVRNVFPTLYGEDDLREEEVPKLRISNPPDELSTEHKDARALTAGISDSSVISNSLSTSKKADLAIVFQFSRRIRNADLRRKFVPFLSDLLKNADIDSGRTRVALVNYGATASVQFYLNTHKSLQNINNILSKLNPKKIKDNKANGGDALDKVLNDVFTAARGDRSDVPNGVILITDTKTNVDPQKFLQTASALKASGAEVYTIGVAKADANELRRIGTPGFHSDVGAYKDFSNSKLVEAVSSRFMALNPPAEPVTLPPTLRPALPGRSIMPLVETARYNPKADIAVVFQLSKNVRNVPYRRHFLPFLSDLIDKADIDNGNVRVALVNYGAKASVQFPLTKFNSKAKMKKAFEKVSPKLKNKKANAGSGLSVVRNQVFTAANGDRPDAVNKVIVITDSKSNVQPSEFTKEAKLLKDAGAQIYTIGIDKADPTELQAVASPGLTTSVGSVTDLRKPATLSAIRAQNPHLSDVPPTPAVIVTEPPTTTRKTLPSVDPNAQRFAASEKADIVFHLHSSQRTSARDFQRMKDYVKSLVNGADVDSGRVRFGLSIGQSYTPFQLNTYPSKADLTSAIDGLTKAAARSRGLDLPRTLQNVRTKMFTSPNGDRNDAPNALILITDEPSNQPSARITDEATRAKSDGINIYTVGVGLTDKSQLEDVASSTNTIFTVSDHNDLGRAGNMIRNNVRSLQSPTTTPTRVGITAPPVLRGCDELKMDLVLILDTSTSVTKPNFVLMLKFLKSFLEGADIDSGNVRVGVIIYSTEDHVQFHLNQYSKRQDIYKAIDKIPYRFGSTNTADALKTMHSEMYTARNGDRPDADNICILITDGVSNINSRKTIPEAVNARNKNIHMYVIGIGLTDTREVDKIATPPLEKNRFIVKEFDELDVLKSQVFASYCIVKPKTTTPAPLPTTTTERPTTTKPTERPRTTKPTLTEVRPTKKSPIAITLPTKQKGCNSKLDLVFVVDTSTSVTEPNFVLMMNFLKNFLQVADIDSGSVRVGIVIYSTEDYIQFQLNEYSTRKDVYNAIDNIPYKYGSTNTADALKTMHTEMYTARNGDRPDADNICILITDGVSNINSRKTIPEGKNARNKGIHMYVIAIGLKDTREVDGIATPPVEENRFAVKEFDELIGLRDKVFTSLCGAPLPTLPPPTIRTTPAPTTTPRPTAPYRDTGYDVIVMLDKAVTDRQMDWMKGFAKDIVKEMDVDNGEYRVGAMTFDTRPNVEYNLDKHHFSDEAAAPYDKYTTSRGPSDIAGAFDAVRTQMFTPRNGDRPRARNFVVMVTGNERARNSPAAVAAAKRLENEGTGVFTVGLNLRDTDEIDGISTKPLDRFRYLVNDRGNLRETPGQILYHMRNAGPIPPPTTTPRPTTTTTTPRPTTTRRTTTRRTTTRRTTTRRTTTRRTTTTPRPTAYSPTGYDVIYMLDSTVNPSQYSWMKDFSKALVNAMDVDSGEYRVGAMTFGRSPRTEYDLDKFHFSDEAVVPIDKFRDSRGEPDVARAFNAVRDRMFRTSRGDRPRARNFVIMVTGKEKSLNTPQAIAAAKRLEAMGTGIYTIGLNLPDTTEIDGIATKPLEEYRFNVNSKSELLETPGIILYNMKNADIITPPPTTPRPTTTRRPITRRPTREPINYDFSTSDCKTTADILFLIDTSGSVGQDNFGKMLNFTIAVAAQLDIDLGLHRVGMMTFSDDAHIAFHLNQYTRKSELIDAIRRVTYYYGYTNTAEAFRTARLQMLTPNNGDRADSPNMIVIVTDGESNVNPTETIPEARYLKRDGNSIITVGVGFSKEYINANTHQSNELKSITSPPVDENLIFVSNYDELVHLKDKLTQPICTDPDACQLNPCQNGGLCFDGLRSYTCQCQPDFFGHDCEKSCTEPADVAFVLDSSTSVGSTNFGRMKAYADELLRDMNIENCNIRVGALKYSSAAMMQFNLGEMSDTESVSRALNRISYTRGRANMADALYTLRTRMFNGYNGDRSDVKNVVYFLTDGTADINRDTTMAEAELAIQSGIRIVPIGVDLRDREEVENIAESQGMTLMEIAANDEGLKDKKTIALANLYSIDATIDTSDYCSSDPCMNDGTCYNEPGKFRCECREGFSGETCEQECNGKADVIFVVDSSRYTTRKEFRKFKRFVRNIVIKMTFRRGAYRVGIVQYGSTPRIALTLANGEKKRRVQSTVAGLRLIGGDPEPASALRTVLYSMVGSAGDRRGVTNYVVFLTRSMRNYPEISKAANKIKSTGARIISVGYDTTSSMNNQLKTIVSNPIEDTHLLARDTDDLGDIAAQFTTFVCETQDLCRNNPCLNNGKCENGDKQYICVCPRGFAGKNCERTCTSEADIVFLVDSSGSVGAESFRTIKEFIHNFVDNLNIAPEYTRVGVATFGDYSRAEIYLDSFSDKKNLQNAISGMHYEYGGTNTAAGLKLSRTKLFSKGRGDREDVPNFMIIITDGLSNIKAENTIPEAEAARKQGIHIFSVGVGVSDRWEVDAMATEPIDRNAFLVENFEGLNGISEDLLRYVCRDASVCSDNPCQNGGECIPGIGEYICQCQAGFLGKSCEIDCRARKDIAFIVDSSNSVGTENFQVMVNFLAGLVELLSQGGQDHRYSLIVYSTEVRLVFSFGRYLNPDQVMDAIYTTRYMPGATNTAGGLRIAEEVFGSGYGERFGADNVAVLITDGQSNLNFDDTIPAATDLKEMGVKVISLGIGLKNTAEIEAIASTSSDVFQVTSFDTLEAVKSDILGNSCIERGAEPRRSQPQQPPPPPPEPRREEEGDYGGYEEGGYEEADYGGYEEEG